MLENIFSGITYLRNPAICKVLREANYIEKLGSGIITIFSSYEEYGLETPQLIDGGDYVKCILPRNKKKIDTTEINEEAKIMELFKIYKEISVKDVENKLAISRSTALRRLNVLIKQGVIQRIGHKRNVRYRNT